MIPEYLLRRYELQDNKVRKELERLEDWTNVLPIGQPPESYEIAWRKLLHYQERKPYQTWLKMRSYVLPNGKTLWQCFPQVIGPSHLPPYLEIKNLLHSTKKKEAQQ